MEQDKVFARNVRIARSLLVVFLLALAVFILVFCFVYGMSDFLVILGLSMFFIGPAYIANAMMVFTKTINHPMDGGRYFIDGRRLFGQTKTWGGFLGGILFGFVAGVAINLVFWFSYPSINAFALTQLALLKYPVTLNYLQAFLYPNVWLIPVRALFCGLGAPIGDLVKSFFKRRLSIGSGGPFWIADQLDFIVATVLLNLAWFPLNRFNILLLLFMTPSVTLFANYVAYSIGRKKEPW